MTNLQPSILFSIALVYAVIALLRAAGVTRIILRADAILRSRSGELEMPSLALTIATNVLMSAVWPVAAIRSLRGELVSVIAAIASRERVTYMSYPLVCQIAAARGVHIEIRAETKFGAQRRDG